MTISSSTFLAILVALVSWGILFGGKLPKPFCARNCQGKSWRRAFPQASKEDIRKFLSTFTESFAFKDKEKLKLNPDDRLLDIYQASYPYKWQADALEFETLSIDLQSKYGFNLSNAWHENLTLGQLFACLKPVGK